MVVFTAKWECKWLSIKVKKVNWSGADMSVGTPQSNEQDNKNKHLEVRSTTAVMQP